MHYQATIQGVPYLLSYYLESRYNPKSHQHVDACWLTIVPIYREPHISEAIMAQPGLHLDRALQGTEGLRFSIWVGAPCGMPTLNVLSP